MGARDARVVGDGPAQGIQARLVEMKKGNSRGGAGINQLARGGIERGGARPVMLEFLHHDRGLVIAVT